MPTFDGRKVLFLHIPKTAGTSIKHFFFQFFTEAEICPDWDEMNLKNDLAYNIRTFRFFHGHFNYDILQFFPDDTIVFTFLRSPLSHLLSSYYFARSLSEVEIKSLPLEAQESAFAARQRSLQEYLQGDDWFVARMVTNVQTRKLANSSDHPIDDVDWHTLATQAIINSSKFEFVGRVETLSLEPTNLLGRLPTRVRDRISWQGVPAAV